MLGCEANLAGDCNEGLTWGYQLSAGNCAGIEPHTFGSQIIEGHLCDRPSTVHCPNELHELQNAAVLVPAPNILVCNKKARQSLHNQMMRQ